MAGRGRACIIDALSVATDVRSSESQGERDPNVGDQTPSAAVSASDANTSKRSPSTNRPRWWPLLVLALASWGFGSWLVLVWLGIRTGRRLWFVVAGVSTASFTLAFYVAARTGPDSASSTVAGLVLAANWIGTIACVLVVRQRFVHPGDDGEQAQSGRGSLPRHGALTWRRRKSSSPGVSKQPPNAPPKLWVALVFAAAVIALSIRGTWVFVSNEIQDVTLAHQGVTLMADITGKDHQNEGDGTAEDYLWVRIPACGCSVLVPTDNPAAHPVGSKIPVRYNPHDPHTPKPSQRAFRLVW